MPVEISYFAAFIAGLLGGVHCLGMCGGIVGALTFGINPGVDNHADSPMGPQPTKNIYPYLLAYIGGWWAGLRNIERAGGMIWKRIEPVSRRFIPVKSPFQALILGSLWGWLPCGLVYTILFWSISTGSAIEGGLLMLSFGLGTLPMLLAMGVFAATLTNFIRKQWVRNLAGGIIIAFGLFSLFNISLRMQA